MTHSLEKEMEADRALRDAAKSLVKSDIEHLKQDFAHKGLAERSIDRVREGATDIYEEAVEMASDNKGALVALVAAAVVWFTRNPILSIFGIEMDDDYTDDETGHDNYVEESY